MERSGAVESAITQPTAETPPPKQRRWVTAVTDRVSTKWLGGIFTAVVLAATAAFGGLATAAEQPLPELVLGDTFTGAGLEMTPTRLLLIDDLDGTGVTPQEGERLLVVVMDVTNRGDEARSSAAEASVAAVRVEGAPDVQPSIARIDDSTLSPWLQPDVPVELVLTWAVPSKEFADGATARIALPTATEFTGTTLIDGTYWDDVAFGAFVSGAFEDLGGEEEEGAAE